MQKNKVIIFDCDGTILDTFLLIEKTVYATFEKMFPNYSLSKKEAHDFFGPSLKDSFKKYVDSDIEVDKCIACYREINNNLMEEYISIYEGIDIVLETLKKQNYKIAIVSNKVTSSVIKGLQICNVDHYFDLIIGADKLKVAKPDPDGIYQVLDLYNTKDAIMIGDTLIDIKTGQNANIPTIGVTWCKTSKEQFLMANATYIATKPLELLDILGAK